MTDNTDMEVAVNKLMQSTSIQEFYNARYKNLGIAPAQTQKIPAILHHIWLTNPANPKDISTDNIEQTKTTIKLFAEDGVNNWQFKIWTNDLAAVATARAALEPLGVTFHEIAELGLGTETEANINYIINKQYWGMGSDALRYVIVQQQGGFYADFGAEFHRAPGLDLYRYDFLTNQWEGSLNANNFFAAKIGHPALIKTNEVVENNLIMLRTGGVELGYYSSKDLTTELTAEPFNIGFYYNFITNFGNATTTIDVVIPHSRFHNNKNFYFDGIDPDAPKQCHLWDKDQPLDICAADQLFIGQDPLPGESWYSTETEN